jgi:hypothetical protein
VIEDLSICNLSPTQWDDQFRSDLAPARTVTGIELVASAQWVLLDLAARYWPDQAALDGTWKPPMITRTIQAGN